ncbi:HNH endonuclease [Corallococcus sp. EGB]|uniref:HNH endonuclease n=1 Tax=Corallococcus sp. EGB TaxID=1521117 RepID=UPI001CC105C4|nr:HNH endonuclease [Corallococcus sp. EGB]
MPNCQPKPRKRRNIAERFWEKVRKGEGCWEWTLAHLRGYGVFTANGKHLRAHRVAWELTNGPIPEGVLVCHHCDNPGCVRPDHLFLGSNADNNADRDSKGRQARGAKVVPRTLPRGDEHWTRRQPDRLQRGDANPSRRLREKLKRGESHPNAKLTREVVLEIRAAHAEGVLAKALAERFGVSRHLIYRVVKKTLWAHVVSEKPPETSPCHPSS